MTQAEFKSVDYDPFSDGGLLYTVPTTEAQKEIWLSIQIGGPNANCAYNESVVLDVDGGIDVKVMEGVLQTIIDRHEALRATISPDGDTLCISEGKIPQIPFMDMSQFEAEDAERQLAILLEKEVTTPFDLEHGPLFQAKIIKLRENKYKIILTGHHIILDGWSIAVVVEDLGKLYGHRIKGEDESLATADRFSEYAMSVTDFVQGQQGLENEAYWLGQFSDSVPVMDLPARYNRPVQRTFKAGSHVLELDKELITRLKKLSAQAKCSLTATLLAGFNILLYRRSAQNELVVGIPAADQAATGLHYLVGHCVNTLPLKSRIEAEDTILDYLKKLKTSMLDAYEHQRFTFGSLLKKLKTPRDLGRVPLVSILFNIDPGIKNLNVGGHSAALKTNLRKFENFDLFFNGTETEGKLSLECLYNADIYDAETMVLQLREYRTILAHMTENPDCFIADLTIMPDDEYRKQILEFNKTELAYPQDRCVHDLFRETAAEFSTKTAVVFDDQSIDYRALDQRSDAFCEELKRQGARPGTLIGVYMERCIDMVSALLGILKAGSAYVPLDPEYPDERIAYMMENAEIQILVTQSHLAANHKDKHVRAICMDTWNTSSAPESSPEKIASDEKWYPPTPENLAYVIYTSGSTGKPKGVKVHHRALVNFLTTMADTPGITANDILLAVTTLSFDIAGLELFLPLLNGATVVLASRETASDGSQLCSILESSQATMMQATPSTWRMMLDAEWKGNEGLKVLCGGEAFPKDLAREMIPKCKEVWNMYGPTETTIWSTCYRLEDEGGPILIGKPIGNTKVYILDSRLKPQPITVPGELYIGGDSVTQGYLNRPDLTANAFLQDPFIPDRSDAMMYKTGDLCRILPDGNLEYIARLDHQVKVRGFRIELGEIETVLSKHETIKQAVCVVKEFGPGDTRLAAYIIKQSGCELDNALIRNHLRKSLPAYMIPQYFIELEDVPLTPAGKVNRKKLIADFEIGSEIGTQEYVAPVTPTELDVARIWSEVLNAERIGKTDNFFEIGGHSLLATRVVSRINRTFGIEMKPGELFLSPTIEGLAVLIDKMNQSVENDLDRETMEF